MNICIYQPRLSYYVGGGEIIPLEHAKRLSLEGFNVTILTSKVAEESKLFIDFKKSFPNINIEYLNPPKNIQYIYDIPAGNNQKRWDLEAVHLARKAFEYLVDKKDYFDIVAVHYLMDVLAIPHKLSSVLHIHGYPENKRYDYQLWFSMVDNCCFVSNHVLNNWKKLSTLPKNVSVIYNGVDTNKYKPIPNVKKKYDLSFLGRLIPVKGVDQILRSASTFKDKKLKIAIAGKGPYEEKLVALSKKLKIEDQIDFLGFIPDSELVDFYNSTKIFITPSYSREGVLTTALESLSCGTPVIASKNGSLEELIENNVNGYLIDPENPTEIVDKVQKLLSNNEFETMSKAARSAIKNGWNWDGQIKKIISFYKNIVS